MKFSETDLICEDIMWFGIDKNGYIFECTSAGVGNIPAFVCKSREETDMLEEYFLNTATKTTVGKILIKDEENDLCNDCKTLSSKGLFCYDAVIEDNHHDYIKIAEPEEPITINDLPDEIKSIMESHKVDVDVTTEININVQHAYSDEEKQDSGYRFRQVICPFCKHQYMTRVYNEYDLIIKHNGELLYGWKDRCTKCDSWIYAIDNRLEGVEPSSFPKDEITEHFILR